MTYKVTARTPKGNLSVEVEGESRYRCLDLARHFFRRAFGEDLADNDIWWKEVEDVRKPTILEMIEQTSHAIAMMNEFSTLDEQLDCIEALKKLRNKLTDKENTK